MKKNKNKSFTLIETIIAIALISIVIAATFKMVSMADNVFIRTLDRESLLRQINNMFEDMESDKTNIINYGSSINVLTSNSTTIPFLNEWNTTLTSFGVTNAIINIETNTTLNTINQSIRQFEIEINLFLPAQRDTSLDQDINLTRIRIINE